MKNLLELKKDVEDGSQAQCSELEAHSALLQTQRAEISALSKLKGNLENAIADRDK